MGNRLSKIVTRTGDDGTTGLGDGNRTDKDSVRIKAIGDVDELNSYIGLLLSEPMAVQLHDELLVIQHALFDLGGELSIPGHTMLTGLQLSHLELIIEKINAELLPLEEFILPGGTRASAIAQVCRSICRRAERTLVSLNREEKVSEIARQYVNRLSDFLFILARELNRQAGTKDVLWQRI